MAKSTQEYEAFVVDLIALCERHRVGVQGTCWSESIHGEILLFDLDDSESAGWDLDRSATYRDNKLVLQVVEYEGKIFCNDPRES